MNHQQRALKLSLFIHSVVFVAITILSMYAGNASKRLVIDFSLIKSTPGPARTVKKIVAKKPVVKKAVVKPRPKPVVKESPVEVPKEIEKETGKEEPEPVLDEPEETVEPVEEVTDQQSVVETASVSGTEGGAAILGRDFIYIRELVQGNISYPRIARRMGLEGKVIISFVILTNGTVRDIRVVESSGNTILDRNAIEAVKRTSPFPRHRLEAKVIIPIQYTLQ